MGQRHPPVLRQEPEGGGPAADALPQAQVPRPLRRKALRDHEGELRARRQEICHQESICIYYLQDLLSGDGGLVSSTGRTWSSRNCNTIYTLRAVHILRLQRKRRVGWPKSYHIKG